MAFVNSGGYAGIAYEGGYGNRVDRRFNATEAAADKITDRALPYRRWICRGVCEPGRGACQRHEHEDVGFPGVATHGGMMADGDISMTVTVSVASGGFVTVVPSRLGSVTDGKAGAASTAQNGKVS